VVCFRVVDIQSSYEALRHKGVTLLAPPQRVHRVEAGTLGPRGSEEWMAFFHEPDGNTLAVVARRPSGPLPN
jgi:methylmalonyl-CoA/ethylmalonyl-CoA epimerase